MSWFSSFIRSSAAKALWKLSVQIFVIKLGKSGKELIETAKTAAIDAELSGKSGSEKREMVLSVLKDKFRSIKQGFLDTAVQLAWSWVDEFLKENADHIQGNLQLLKYAK